jgi:hypothetical protein
MSFVPQEFCETNQTTNTAYPAHFLLFIQLTVSNNSAPSILSKMRFSSIATSILLLSTTGSIAKPIPAPVPSPQLLDPLGQLESTLSALLNLLQGQTLDNIVSLVDNGAALLTPQFVNETQSLVALANAVSFSMNIFIRSDHGTD